MNTKALRIILGVLCIVAFLVAVFTPLADIGRVDLSLCELISLNKAGLTGGGFLRARSPRDCAASLFFSISSKPPSFAAEASMGTALISSVVTVSAAASAAALSMAWVLAAAFSSSSIEFSGVGAVYAFCGLLV